MAPGSASTWPAASDTASRYGAKRAYTLRFRPCRMRLGTGGPRLGCMRAPYQVRSVARRHKEELAAILDVGRNFGRERLEAQLQLYALCCLINTKCHAANIDGGPSGIRSKAPAAF